MQPFLAISSDCWSRLDHVWVLLTTTVVPHLSASISGMTIFASFPVVAHEDEQMPIANKRLRRLCAYIVSINIGFFVVQSLNSLIDTTLPAQTEEVRISSNNFEFA